MILARIFKLVCTLCRNASIAREKIPLGHRFHSVSLSAWTALLSTDRWAYTLVLFAPRSLTVPVHSLYFAPLRIDMQSQCTLNIIVYLGWSTEQLLPMMVGGNAKAAEFFKVHGWTDEGADQRTAKFTSRAATMYKQHIQKEVKQQRSAILQTLVPSPVKEAKPASLLSGMVSGCFAGAHFQHMTFTRKVIDCVK